MFNTLNVDARPAGIEKTVPGSCLATLQAGTSPGSHRTTGPQVHQAHGGMPVPPHHLGTLDSEDTGTGK